jgi:nucleotide-binding universal stress UspA family protein
MRVLAAVDGSQQSNDAIQFVCRLLSEERDDLVLFFAAPGSFGVGDYLDSAQRFLASSVLDKAQSCVPQEFRLRVSTAVCGGEAGHSIVRMANERHCDVIVIGARGIGPLREPTLGSVARHVVNHARVPVVVSRHHASRKADQLKVLLASDGSLTSRHATEVMNRFNWPKRTSGMALTVVESTLQAHLPNWLEEQLEEAELEALGMGRFCCDEQQEAQLRAEAANWYGCLPDFFSGRDPLIAVGHAGKAILDAIAAHQIDLVVVGARRLGPIQRLFLGSTSSQVVSYAPCSVLVAPGTREDMT